MGRKARERFNDLVNHFYKIILWFLVPLILRRLKQTHLWSVGRLEGHSCSAVHASRSLIHIVNSRFTCFIRRCRPYLCSKWPDRNCTAAHKITSCVWKLLKLTNSPDAWGNGRRAQWGKRGWSAVAVGVQALCTDADLTQSAVSILRWRSRCSAFPCKGGCMCTKHIFVDCCLSDSVVME